jgi:hypothetical protein
MLLLSGFLEKDNNVFPKTKVYVVSLILRLVF